MTKKTLTQKLKKTDTGINKLLLDETGKVVGKVIRKRDSDTTITLRKGLTGRMYRFVKTSIDQKSEVYNIVKDPISGKLKSEPPIYFPTP